MLDAISGMFKKKRKLIAVFVDETGTVTQKRKVYANNVFHDKDGFTGEKEAYIVDHNFTVYDKRTHLPMSFYYKHNPQPMLIRHQRNMETDAVGFQHILDSKAIADLFSNKGLGQLLWVLVIVGANLFITLILVAIQMGWIKTGAT